MASRGKNKLTENQVTQLVHDVHNFGLNIHAREIFVNGHISDTAEEDPGVDYRVAGTFLRNLHILESLGRSKITIHMSITGGEWSYGMGIYDAIKSSRSHITIIAYALASSMSGVILQAADTRIMMPGAHFMLHYGSIGLETTSQAASEMVRFNDRENEKMVGIFADRCLSGSFFVSKRWGIKRIAEYLHEQIRRHGDWYLTSEEALEYGFCDQVLSAD